MHKLGIGSTFRYGKTMLTVTKINDGWITVKADSGKEQFFDFEHIEKLMGL